MDNTVAKLRELTKVVAGDILKTSIEYKTTNGTAIGFGLFADENVAIQRVFFSAGTKFSNHIHDNADEYCILVSGCLIFSLNGKEPKITRGGVFIVNPLIQHSAHAIEDTWAIFVSIPPVVGYPGTM